MRVKTCLSLMVVGVVACSKTNSTPMLAPRDRLQATYEEIFQRGPMLPMEKRIEAFLAKVTPPKHVEGDKRTWFARDAANDCYEVTLLDSGTMTSSKIFDQARADAECGPQPK